jgi:Class III cytochrome C family
MKAITSPLLTVILAFLLFLIVGTLKASEKQSVPEEIIFENEGYKSDKKGPVEFSHLNHSEDYEVACTDCHHDYQDGKNVWKEGDPVKKCIECHSPLKSEGKVKRLNLAFHRNCKNCHKDLAKKGITKEAPYKKCNDCHQKGS